jgi:hypothetical protein
MLVAGALVACGSDGVRGDGVSDPLDQLPDASIDSAPDGGVDPDAPPGDDGPSPPLTLCEQAAAHSDLAWIEANVLVPSCTNGCHNAAHPYANLRLDGGLARSNLVGVPSTLRAGWTRVVAGSPSESYLLVAIGHISGPIPDDGYMPLGSPRLCVEIRDAIQRWIAAGAL